MVFDAVAATGLILDGSLRSLAAAASVALVLWLLRVQAAGVLHSAWSAVLLAMLFMPALSSIVPALPIPALAGDNRLLRATLRTELLRPGSVASSTQAPAASIVPMQSTPLADSVSPGPSASVSNAGATHSWLALLLGLYGTVVLLMIARLLYGWCLASAMIHRARRGGAIHASSCM
jgi:hypothetical protein